MSHFNNVRHILELGLENDSVALAEHLEKCDKEIFADDLCYILCSIAGKLGKPEMDKLKNFLIDGITRHDFNGMLKDYE